MRLMATWVLSCAAAEGIGMTASSAAATVSQEPGIASRTALALSIVVLGGLVEGVALGVLQARALSRRWPGVARRRYAVVTVLVAGVGWAAGSAPAVLGGADAGGSEPPLAQVLVGAAGLGVLMGAVLGYAQSTALRGAVRRPGRWVIANTVAWLVVMPAIFFGASRPGEDWSVGSVLLFGLLTGILAGMLLGVFTGMWFRVVEARSEESSGGGMDEPPSSLTRTLDAQLKRG
jgi:uncharacterized integral membrane protein